MDAILEAMKNYETLPHDLGESWFVWGTHLELYDDGSGKLHVELHRDSETDNPLEILRNALGVNRIERAVEFETLDELRQVLVTPLTANFREAG